MGLLAIIFFFAGFACPPLWFLAIICFIAACGGSNNKISSR